MRHRLGIWIKPGSIFWVTAILALWITGCASSPDPPATYTSQPILSTSSADASAQGEFAGVPYFAPGQDLRFDRVSLEQGLSQTSVTAILQDNRGFMWIGTQDGLNKYDGYTFTVYRHDPTDPNSLRDDFIETIFEDSSGVLWVGTQDGWLERFDRATGQFTHTFVSPHAQTIVEDQTGMLWIGTLQSGLTRFDRDTGTLTPMWNGGNVTALLEDRTGVLWAGNEQGQLARYDREHDRFVEIPIGYPITLLIEDQAGQFWIGTVGGGLGRLDRETEELTFFRHEPDNPHSLGDDNNVVLSVCEDPTGALWIGTGSGLDWFEPVEQKWRHYAHDAINSQSLSDNEVLSVYVDQSGALWVGTWAGALNRTSRRSGQFSHYRHVPSDDNSLYDNRVRAIFEDSTGVLWVGTISGLDRFNRATGDWQHYTLSASESDGGNNDVRSVYEDRLGILWVGAENGLYQYDRDRDQFIHYSAPAVMDMLEDRTGTFWLVGKGGMYHFERDTEQFNLVREGFAWKITIYEDQDGIIWVGTSGDGLERYDPQTGNWRRYQHDPDDPTSLSNEFVESILQGEAGMLWIGTDGGLNHLNPDTDTFTHYHTHDGLANDTIVGVLSDREGHLWLSTLGGLSRFDPISLSVQNYYARDGLQSNEFWRGAYYQSGSGEMFFGGPNGFTAFHPEQITDNAYVPPVVITGLTQGGEELAINQAVDEVSDITLTWPHNFFEFEYAALSYVQPEKNQYAYMLDGFDSDWIEMGTRRFGRYTGLPGGTYTLRIRGANNDGVWNEQGVALHVTVVPPFWETWWFRGLVGVALMGIVLGGYRLRMRNIKAQQRDLEEQVKQRTTELQQEVQQRLVAEEALRKHETERAVVAERSRLARELHDSVTQSLYSVTLFAEAARHLAEEADNKELNDYTGRLGKIAQQALKEMRLMVYELRPPELEREGLVRALRQRLEAVEGRAGVEARVVADDVVLLPQDMEQDLYRITQEALNNALKHAAATTVDVYLRQQKNQVELEIFDNGIGFDSESMRDQGGMGLDSIRERAEQMGGHAAIESTPGQGTRVKVVVHLVQKPGQGAPIERTEKEEDHE